MADTESGTQSAGKGVLGTVDAKKADRLKSELTHYALAQTERALAGLGRKLGESTVKLNDIAEGRSPGFARLALDGGRKLAEGKGPLRAGVEVGAARLKDGAKGLAQQVAQRIGKAGARGRKGERGRKPTVVMESVDVGVPVREAYDQWTRYQDFPAFAEGVEDAGAVDDTGSEWDLKVFWSSRHWTAHTTEQIPDERIAWTAHSAKGTGKGVVTFHPLGDSLTRILLVIEYSPKGLFERTGNIWRAQGRRARLDLKNFARYIALRGEAEEGRRDEIRDGEVVRSDDETQAEDDEAYATDDEVGAAEEAEYDDEYEDDPDAEDDVAEDAEDAEDEDRGGRGRKSRR
ncbi:SRPBCC family protein [Streptomyces syringium]|uniref:Membrane protein n=1 Tax=Streptomyces syringium TaxID=76729 RepID=A0ABS4YDI5_9ACTN|nr:SRPBCC family protein [Streptomyces syringium]MBP2406862.1 putative membrane protein [Streptomyces syringium]